MNTEPNVLVKYALNDVVERVNSGVNPTEALSKVAQEFDLNPNYIQRVGEALNVALNYKHFKTAEDRSTSFPIADIPTVVAKHLTPVEKTASEYTSELFPTVELERNGPNFNRLLSNPRYKKAYLEIMGNEDNYDSYKTSLAGTIEKVSKYISALAKEVDHTQTEKVGAEISVNSSFSSLADQFRKDAGYRTSFDEFESQVFAKHGEKAVPYLDLLHKTSKTAEDRGVHDSGYMTFEQCKEAALFDDLMNNINKMTEAETSYKVACDNYNYERDFKDSIFKKEAALDIETEVLPAKKKEIIKKAAESTVDPVFEAMKEKQADGGSSLLDNFTNTFDDLIHTGLFSGIDPKSTKPKMQSGPKNNITMENLERQMILQELMIMDPILSKVPPNKVARAYEQILRLSPQISKEKEVVRAILRNMIASQAVSPYDAEQLTKLDLDMIKRKIVSDKYLGGHADQLRI